MEIENIATHYDVSGAQGLRRLESCDASGWWRLSTLDCDICGGVMFVQPRLRHLRRLRVQQALQRFSVAFTIHIRKSYCCRGMTKAAL